ncbi:MAG TPA: metal ABC transporter ATP-binding protein [Methanocorpusculum sp.]|nr:metal ABC transporter ATP-binding protein [Methanocorpusculum sp.]
MSTSTSSNLLVDLKGVTSTYEGTKYPVIHDIDLSVSSGEFVIIGGPNGAGKTTLLETIAGLIPIVSGSVSVYGLNISKHGSKIRQKLGYVIQNFDFDQYTPFTVYDVMLMSQYGQLGFLKTPNKVSLDNINKSMDCLDITHLKDTNIGKLSGGQQQKVMIAHNLAKNPKILLLDEPFSNLDILSRETLSDLLCKIVKSGVSVIVVSHAFDSLPDMDVRVVLMNKGRIILNKILNSADVHDTIRKISIECD